MRDTQMSPLFAMPYGKDPLSSLIAKQELPHINDPFVQLIVNRESANYAVEVIADSWQNGIRVTTLQLRYPRFIHAEFMTHRMFSRNASSSRARPIKKEIERILDNPAMPIYWGKNQAGMQAKEECIPQVIEQAQLKYKIAMNQALSEARALHDLGVHKQTVNRLLEPYQLMEVVVTATEWENFFNLRIHPDAQPEIIKLAYMMYKAMEESIPVETNWHLPYLTKEEKLSCLENAVTHDVAMRISSARCARVSYKLHDGSETSIEKDLELASKLFDRDFPHASPAEHPCVFNDDASLSGNLTCWESYRSIIGL